MSKRIWSLTSTLLVIAIAAGVWFNQDALFDLWRLRGYQPSAEVVALADKTTMTDSSRRLFYVYHPELQNKAAFNQSCKGGEQTIVLGCYIQHRGIYLYSVDDPRLDGVIEVTAAHEMLHAAYDRLSSKEQARIDALTQTVENNLTDQRLKDTLQSYRSKDPLVVPNERHSIFATEITDLPPELEAYYARYFKDRKAIAAMANKYKGAFTEREDQVKAIDKQLSGLKSQIDSLNSTLESQQRSLKTDFDNLQRLRQGNDISAYNAAVPVYNQSVAAFNANVNKQKQLVTQYNALVERRNGLAVEENELIKAIDSRETIQSQ